MGWRTQNAEETLPSERVRAGLSGCQSVEQKLEEIVRLLTTLDNTQYRLKLMQLVMQIQEQEKEIKECIKSTEKLPLAPVPPVCLNIGA